MSETDIFDAGRPAVPMPGVFLVRIFNDDDTVSLGSDVTGERGDGDTLILRSPHVSAWIAIDAGSRFVHEDGRSVAQMPVFERLLDLPRGTRVPVFEQP